MTRTYAIILIGLTVTTLLGFVLNAQLSASGQAPLAVGDTTPNSPLPSPANPTLLSTARHAGSPERRFVQLRLTDPNGSLLLSSWRGEDGSLEGLDPGSDDGPYAWGTLADLTGPRPLWAGLLDFLHLAPPDSTVQLTNHSFPEDTRVGQISLPKSIDLDREWTLSRSEADATLRKNVTSGANLWFMGQIPMSIVQANAETVTYRFTFNEGDTFVVARSVGLRLVGSILPDGQHVRFAVLLPSEGFIAHNNCQVSYKLIPFGYYRLNSTTDDAFVLDRYNTKLEYALEGRQADVEISFRDRTGAAEMAELKANTTNTR